MRPGLVKTFKNQRSEVIETGLELDTTPAKKTCLVNCYSFVHASENEFQRWWSQYLGEMQDCPKLWLLFKLHLAIVGGMNRSGELVFHFTVS